MGIETIVTDDPLYKNQWNLSLMNIERAWEYSSGLGVKVAVIDSGIDPTHSDFGFTQYVDINANMGETQIKTILEQSGVMSAIKNGTHPKILPGWNFIDDDDFIWDTYRHGTYLAGVIGAMDNDVGIIGVAPNCKLVPYKVIDAVGYGRQIDVVNAINMAVDFGCHVANISLAFPYLQNEKEWEWAVANAVNNGMIIVAATGNNNKNQVYFPAALEGVIAVGGCDQIGQRWVHNAVLRNGSNYGEKMLCIAPAASQPTTWFMRSRWTASEGTSMACANMSGVIALIKSKVNASYNDIADLVAKYSSRSVVGFNIEEGFGVVDSYRVLASLLPEDIEVARIVQRLNVVKLEIENIVKELGG